MAIKHEWRLAMDGGWLAVNRGLVEAKPGGQWTWTGGQKHKVLAILMPRDRFLNALEIVE